MAMASLGSVSEIWHWPLHYYRAVRIEFLKIMSPPKKDDESVTKIKGPKGITIERYTRDR